MNDTKILLDPTAESDPLSRPRLARPTKLDGLTVGLLDISKARGNVFLDRLAERFGERGIEVKRYRKPTFTRLAPTAVKQRSAAEVDVVVEGLAD